MPYQHVVAAAVLARNFKVRACCCTAEPEQFVRMMRQLNHSRAETCKRLAQMPIITWLDEAPAGPKVVER